MHYLSFSNISRTQEVKEQATYDKPAEDGKDGAYIGTDIRVRKSNEW
jgi:hypothetical protein